MTIIHLEMNNEKDVERVLRNVTRIENHGGELVIHQKMKDSRTLIPISAIQDIIE